jgi:hypothetical protein
MSKSSGRPAKMLRLRNPTSMTRRYWRPLAEVALVCAGSLLLASCSTVLSEVPAQMGGLPAGEPQRPDVAPVYPAVHDMPPPRSAAVLTEEERKKVEADLAALRAEQARRANAKLPE